MSGRDPAAQARIDQLIPKIRELGGYDPEGWAEQEVDDDYPMVAVFLFERGLWDIINSYRHDHRWLERQGSEEGPVKRLLAAGAHPADIAGLAANVAYDVCFNILVRLEAEGVESVPEGINGWCLMEADRSGHATGRPMHSLHEFLLYFDPSGRDGRDLWT